MLLILVFSITPKIILHNLLVNHKDISYPSHEHSGQVTKGGFHCDCENQVVEIPYLNLAINIRLDISRSFQIYQTRISYPFYSFPNFIFRLRGPPFSV